MQAHEPRRDRGRHNNGTPRSFPANATDFHEHVRPIARHLWKPPARILQGTTKTGIKKKEETETLTFLVALRGRKHRSARRLTEENNYVLEERRGYKGRRWGTCHARASRQRGIFCRTDGRRDPFHVYVADTLDGIRRCLAVAL